MNRWNADVEWDLTNWLLFYSWFTGGSAAKNRKYRMSLNDFLQKAAVFIQPAAVNLPAHFFLHWLLLQKKTQA